MQHTAIMSRYLILIFLLINSVLAKNNPKPPAPPPIKWSTLTGDEPMVIARGGLSGLFPESSTPALDISGNYVYSDLQISKDGKAFLERAINLENCTNINEIYEKGEKTYDVNGEQVRGWFAVDYTAKQLQEVKLIQSNLGRSNVFDNVLPLLMTSDVQVEVSFWFNVPYYNFYKQRNVNVEAAVVEATKIMDVAIISSPEIGFLKSIADKIDIARTAPIFQIPDVNLSKVEPTTKQPYSQILKDLPSIKEYAVGILVPKQLIWPVNADGFLEPHSSLVADAHKLELQVFAYGFANDITGIFNYSYDPVAEYLNFVDHPDFSVDGLITDHPTSADIALKCFAHNVTNKKNFQAPLIITHGGASGFYPMCTDLAYQQAVNDGADVIDCPVQLSKDGVAFCLGSVNLKVGTSAATDLISKSTTVPEIQPDDGVFSFDCTATEIQSLKPVLSPVIAGLPRHTENKNKGKIITLREFLDIAKTKAVSGIVIKIENAPYLASKKGLSITDIVAKELANATFDKQVTQKVFIQSDDTSVLSYFKNVTTYNKILTIENIVGDIEKQSVEEIKQVASAVQIDKTSIVQLNPNNSDYTLRATNIVDTLHAANVSVYVSLIINEWNAILFDFLLDPYVELTTYVVGMQVDGVVTDYPATAAAYRRSRCYNKDKVSDIPVTNPGSFLESQGANTSSLAPLPALSPANVTDPPLPPVLDTTEKTPSDGPATAPSKNGQPATVANVGFCLALVMVFSYLFN